jgi:hypothetical protein
VGGVQRGSVVLMGVVFGRALRWGGKVFLQHSDFVVGSGNCARFWHDCWCGDHPLMDRFLS